MAQRPVTQSFRPPGRAWAAACALVGMLAGAAAVLLLNLQPAHAATTTTTTTTTNATTTSTITSTTTAPATLRPQLSDGQAAGFAIDAVLAAAGPVQALVVDHWRPQQDPALLATAPPTWHYRVDAAAADGRSVFATVQAAVNQAHLDLLAGRLSAPRVYIGVAPGRYAETVLVPASPRPITLWGQGRKPGDVVIEAAVPAGLAGADYAALRARVQADGLAGQGGAAPLHADILGVQQGCARRERIGTSCSGVLQVRNTGFHLRQLTVANRHDPRTPSPGHQAVALMTDGADRVVIDQVHLLSQQDTLYLKTAAPEQVARVLVQRSLVAGDVDFIFGRGTAYFWRSEIRFIGGARPLGQGYITAASTHQDAPYGLVFDDCDFTSDGLGLAAQRLSGNDRAHDRGNDHGNARGDDGSTQGAVALGRQWFEGAACSPFSQASPGCTLPSVSLASLRAVGKVAVLRSRLGPHLRLGAPWAPWQASASQAGYRPVLYSSRSHWQALTEAGLAQAVLGQAEAPPDQPYLAEYRNLPTLMQAPASAASLQRAASAP